MASSHAILLLELNGTVARNFSVEHGRVRAMHYDFSANLVCYVSVNVDFAREQEVILKKRQVEQEVGAVGVSEAVYSCLSFGVCCV